MRTTEAQAIEQHLSALNLLAHASKITPDCLLLCCAVLRCRYWLAIGAQPSDRVTYLLSKAGLIPPPPQPPRFPKPPSGKQE